MCAINGFSWEDEGLVRAMNRTTAYRGPDATATYVKDGVSLGHNRLAIVDLRPEAGQPMFDTTGRFVIVFNGQIYNFRELREELSAYPYKTQGDTEVILAAYSAWGAQCVERFDGMFAFAIWDREKKELFVARDHQGIKPFYYMCAAGKFAFSSEIAGLLEHDAPRRLDPHAFGLYFQLLYPPAPGTMFEGIKKLPAAHRGWFRDGELTTERYWSASEGRTVVADERRDLSGEVEHAVDAAIRSQLFSDRPLGIYLSGGIDSSVVLDSVSRVRSNINTYSVGFDLGAAGQEEKFNVDLLLARRTSQRYGTTHHEVLLSATDAAEMFEDAVRHLGQPVSNATILPMYRLAHFARKSTVVVLGGDGGDEVFGGYERYRLSLAASTYRQTLPAFIRDRIPGERFAKLNTPPGSMRLELFMAQKRASLERFLSPDAASHLPSVREVFDPFVAGASDVDFEQCFMDADRQTWLTDESLVMSDTLTMSAGLEARVPLLSRPLIELAAEIPQSEKVSLGGTKLILKNAFRHRLPEYLFDQPKRGWFSPGAKWLRMEPFAGFAREVLSESYYRETAGLFNWPEVARMLEEHREGSGYHANALWSIMTFQVWARTYRVTL